MNLNDINTWLILAGIVAVVVEIMLGASTGFDLLLIGIIAVISGIIGTVFKSSYVAIWSIVILSFLYMIIGRKFIKNKLSIETKSTNVESLLGKKAIVVKPINKHMAGQVKIEGEIWRAESDKEIDKGVEVSVESISGVTLRVN